MSNSQKSSALVLVVSALAVAAIACSQQGSVEAEGGTSSSGAALFERLDCIHCHEMDGSGPGPSLVGIYGETVPLESGETVVVDEAYIRASILDPGAQVHAGYQPIMPPYQGRVSEEELTLLAEYIRSLSDAE